MQKLFLAFTTGLILCFHSQAKVFKPIFAAHSQGSASSSQSQRDALTPQGINRIMMQGVDQFKQKKEENDGGGKKKKKGKKASKKKNKDRNFLGIKKKPKKRFVAIGPVFGGPHGFGGRLIVRPIKQFGIAGDVSYNKIRLDEGQAIGVVATKIDGRIYAPNWLGDLFRLYAFAGGTMQSGKFNRESMATVVQGDVGVGAGIKFWRVSINGEVGVLIPVKREANFNPGVGVFGNVALMIWLF